MNTNPLNPILSGFYYRDPIIRINFLFSFLANLSLWLILIGQAKNFDELISLHYNIYFGIDLVGYWYQIFLLPILGLGFFIINFMIASIIYNREKILSYFLAGTSSFVQIILTTSAIFIILINL